MKTGCPKSAQEIWPCFVGLEGQGASSLAFVGSLTCWLLVGDMQDWWWASPRYLIAYTCSISRGHLRFFWPHPWIKTLVKLATRIRYSPHVARSRFTHIFRLLKFIFVCTMLILLHTCIISGFHTGPGEGGHTGILPPSKLLLIVFGYCLN